MDSLTFLNRKPKGEPAPIYVVAGDETFLRRQVLLKLREQILGEESDDFALSTHPGDKAEWSMVRNDVETLAFFGGRRLVIVENADPFVTKYRKQLEKYVTEPAKSGTLVLDVKSFPATTKLAKQIHKDVLITCKAPTHAKLVSWSQAWCKSEWGKELTASGAQLLVDLVGNEMGLLVQEVGKLAVYVGERKRITEKEVDQLVGNNRTETTFRIFNLIGAGQSSEALAMLDQILSQGEEPLRMLGAFGWFLGRLVKVARLTEGGQPVHQAIREAGLRDPSVVSQQLKHLGRRRIEKLYDWLLEVDLGIKGDSPLPPRTLLERLVIRLARK